MINWKDFITGAFLITLTLVLAFIALSLKSIVQYQQHQKDWTYSVQCEDLKRFFHSQGNNIK